MNVGCRIYKNCAQTYMCWEFKLIITEEYPSWITKLKYECIVSENLKKFNMLHKINDPYNGWWHGIVNINYSLL